MSIMSKFISGARVEFLVDVNVLSVSITENVISTLLSVVDLCVNNGIHHKLLLTISSISNRAEWSPSFNFCGMTLCVFIVLAASNAPSAAPR